QDTPHAPQLLASLSRSTHWLPHRLCLHADGKTQPPSRQTWPFAHWESVMHAWAQTPTAQTSPLVQSLWVEHLTASCSLPMGMSPLLQAPVRARASNAANESDALTSGEADTRMLSPREWEGRGSGGPGRRARGRAVEMAGGRRTREEIGSTLRVSEDRRPAGPGGMGGLPPS